MLCVVFGSLFFCKILVLGGEGGGEANQRHTYVGCCIFYKVDTKNRCSNTLLIESRYCRDLKKVETKTEKPCPTLPKSYMVC